MTNAPRLPPPLLLLGASRAYLDKAASRPKRQGASPSFFLGAACGVRGGQREQGACGWVGTELIPSCIPGESEDNCTALVQMEDDPRVAQVQITKCSSDMDGYCLHGQCIYLVDMREKFCRCEVGYTGLRCEHFFLTVHQPLSKEYVALTVILIFLFLIITAGCIYYFCRWYKNRKSKKSREEYERVTSGDPVLPQVWTVPSSYGQGFTVCLADVNIFSC